MTKPMQDHDQVNFNIEFDVKGIRADGREASFKLTIKMNEQAKPLRLSDIGSYIQREVYECVRIIGSNLKE